MSARQFPARLRSVLMQNWRGLLTSAVQLIALLLGAAHLSRDHWIELDAQQWNRWFPSGRVPAKAGDQTADEHPRYTRVRYRIERDYDHGQTTGLVVLETTYEVEVATGPLGYRAENGWLWRIAWALRTDPFKVATWQNLGGLSVDSYRSEQGVYEYICPSQEVRYLRSRYENVLGMRGTLWIYHTNSQSGWSNGLENWTEVVNEGDPIPLGPLAPIWPRLCRDAYFPPVQHFTFELMQQRERAVHHGHHRIWIPFPAQIRDPAATHGDDEAWPMEVCAEESASGRLLCRLWTSGDDPGRHALLLEPGTYRFFQKYYDKLPERFCGPRSPCRDTTRWYWRTHTRGPVQITLKDQGPGTRVGPQIEFFDVEQVEDEITWTWPAPGNRAAPEFGPASRDKWLTVAGKRGDPIVASADGRVYHAGPGPDGYGTLITLVHNGIYLTHYAHVQTLLVKEGQEVRKGQKIATMGSTGTDRVQLYFEIRRRDKRVSPADYLNGR